MRARAIGLAGSLILGVVFVVAGTFQVSGQPNEADAVQQVLQKYISTINSAEFAKGPREKRAEMLRAFYRPDRSFAKDDPPMFMGPLSEPVSRSTDAHIDNVLTNFEFLFKSKMTYGTRIDEAQIQIERGLAAVTAMTTSGYKSADGKTNYVAKGRATIILTKMSNNQWMISHEHTELYNDQNPAVMSKARLKTEIEKLPE